MLPRPWASPPAIGLVSSSSSNDSLSGRERKERPIVARSVERQVAALGKMAESTLHVGIGFDVKEAGLGNPGGEPPSCRRTWQLPRRREGSSSHLWRGVAFPLTKYGMVSWRQPNGRWFVCIGQMICPRVAPIEAKESDRPLSPDVCIRSVIVWLVTFQEQASRPGSPIPSG